MPDEDDGALLAAEAKVMLHSAFQPQNMSLDGKQHTSGDDALQNEQDLMNEDNDMLLAAASSSSQLASAEPKPVATAENTAVSSPAGLGKV